MLTFSAGQPLRVVAMGLLEDVSLASARKVLESTYCHIVEQISLNDRRKPEAKLMRSCALARTWCSSPGERIKRNTFDGKTDRPLGAYPPTAPPESRPDVLYAGNTAITKQVTDRLEPLCAPMLCPMCAPTLTRKTYYRHKKNSRKLFTCAVHINWVACNHTALSVQSPPSPACAPLADDPVPQ